MRNRRRNRTSSSCSSMTWATPTSAATAAHAQTTNIDRIASEGVRFTQFYVGAPICSPSRVAFTTGQYAQSLAHHVVSRDATDLTKNAGWSTGSIRKPRRSRERFTTTATTPRTSASGTWAEREVARCATDHRVWLRHIAHELRRPRRARFIRCSMERIAPVPGRRMRRLAMARSVRRTLQGDRNVRRSRFKEMDNAQKAGKPFYINLWPDDVHSPCLAPPDMPRKRISAG